MYGANPYPQFQTKEGERMPEPMTVFVVVEHRGNEQDHGTLISIFRTEETARRKAKSLNEQYGKEGLTYLAQEWFVQD